VTVERWVFRAILTSTLLASSPARADAPPPAGPEAEARGFLAAWEERKPRCTNNEPGCAAAGQALFKAAEAFERAGKLDKAIVTRRMILDPSNHLDFTDYGRKTLFLLAANYEGLTEYAEAAKIHEMAAQKFPKEDAAPDSLSSAVVFRLALHDEAKAIQDIELYTKLYGTKRSKELSGLAVGMGDVLVTQERFAEAQKWLDRWMRTILRSGRLDDVIHAHTLLARIHAKLGREKDAEEAYATVRGLWKDQEAAVKKIDDGQGEEGPRLRRLGRALTNVGEAVFFFAEKKRAAVDAMHFPEFKGPASMAAISTHISTKVSPWMQKKRVAVEEAERAYQEVLALQPMAPPKWVIASAEQVGGMWAAFVDDFRNVPVPREWQAKGKHAEIGKVYREQLSSASEPMHFRAKAAYKKCVDVSMKYQYFDERALRCGAWLAKHFRGEFTTVDEVAPGFAGVGSWWLPAPLANEGRQGALAEGGKR